LFFAASDKIAERVRLVYTGGSGSGEFDIFAVLAVSHRDGKHRALSGVDIKELPATDPNYKAFPSPEDCTIGIRYDGPPTKQERLFIDDIHVVELFEHLVDGKFSRLGADGSVLWGLNKKAATFTSFKADLSWGTFRGQIPEEAKIGPWVEEHLGQVYGLGYRITIDGEIEPVDLRQLFGVSPGTITNDMIATDSEPRWVAGAEPITKIRADWFTEERVDLADVTAVEDKVPSVRPGLVLEHSEETEMIDSTKLVDIGPTRRVLKAIGIRGMWREFSQSQLAHAHAGRVVKGRMSELLLQFSGGRSIAEIVTVRDAVTNDLFAGDYRIVDVDDLPDPSTLLRGGPRLMMCVSRQEEGPRYRFLLLDTGLNATALVPTIGTLALTSQDEEHSVDVPITINADSDLVIVQFAITATSEGTRPVEGSALWTYAHRANSTATTAIANLPAGQRVWIRARSNPFDTRRQQPSAWVFPTDGSPVGSIDLSAFAVPSSLNETNLTGRSVKLNWTVGDADLGVEVYLGLDGGSLSSLGILPPTTNELLVGGLVQSTTYDWYVRHVGPHGDPGAFAALDGFTTTDATNPAPDTGVPVILFGLSDHGNDDGNPRPSTGIFIQIQPGSLRLRIAVQETVETSPGNGVPDDGAASDLADLPPGLIRLIRGLPLDGTVRFYRARHEGGEFDAGGWSGWSAGAHPVILPDYLDLDFDIPEVASATPVIDVVGNVTVAVVGKFALSAKVSSSITDYPDAVTTRLESELALDSDGAVTTGTLETLEAGETIYVSVLVYENDDGTGIESPQLFKVQATRGATSTTIEPQIDGFSAAQNAAAPENGNVFLEDEGDVAYSNQEKANEILAEFTVFYDINATALPGGESATVEIAINDGPGSTNWTTRVSQAYTNADDLTDESQSFSAAMGENWDIRVRLTYSFAPGEFEKVVLTVHGEDHGSEAGVQFDKVVASAPSLPETVALTDAANVFSLDDAQTFRRSSATLGSEQVVLENLDTTVSTLHTVRQFVRFADTSANVVLAGEILWQKKQDWTSTPSTQDTILKLRVTQAGTIQDALIIDGDDLSTMLAGALTATSASFNSGTVLITGAGRLDFSGQASPRIVSGTVDFGILNNASSVNLLNITDAGVWTLGGTASVSMGALTAAGITLSDAAIKRSVANSLISFSGGSDGTLGANFIVYGESHATKADYIEFREDTTNILVYNGTSWSFGSLAVAMGALTATTGTFSGNVLIGTTTTSASGGGLEIEKSISANFRSQDTVLRLSYHTTENGGTTAKGYALVTGSNAALRWGGGSTSLLYAVQSHTWYTAANYTTNATAASIAADITGVGASSLFYTRGDLRIADLGTFDSTSAPSTDFILRYDGAKWVSAYLHTQFFAGDGVSQVNGDGTTSAFVYSSPSLSGTPSPNPSTAPVTTASHKAIMIDMSAYVLGATETYVLDYSINGGAYTTNAIITTGPNVVHATLAPGSTYAYKYKIRGGSDTLYSPIAGAINPLSDSSAHAFGIVLAANIVTSNLAAISADIGEVTAGILRSASSEVVLHLNDKIFTVSDGSYDRVKLGLIGSYYGIQFKDAAGLTTLDTANADGRLRLQVGASTTLAPSSQLLDAVANLSTTSSTIVTLWSFNIPANALVTNGDTIRLVITGKYTVGHVNNVCNLKVADIIITTVGGQANPETFRIAFNYTRTGTDTQRYTYTREISTSSTPYAIIMSTGTDAEDDASTIELKVDGKIGGGTLTIYSVLCEYLGL
jgi:hypothetical protein